MLTYNGQNGCPRHRVEVRELVAHLTPVDPPAVQHYRVQLHVAGVAAQFLTRQFTQSRLTPRSRPRSYVYIDSLHWEDLHLVLHGGHEPEELLAVFVPVHGVQARLLQVKVTAQPGRLTKDQLIRHLETSHCQRPTAYKDKNIKAQTEYVLFVDYLQSVISELSNKTLENFES